MRKVKVNFTVFIIIIVYASLSLEFQPVNATPLPVQTSIIQKRKRSRCGQCEACLANDCGTCAYCLDMVKYGGPGKKKKACLLRRCQEQGITKYN